MECQKRHFNIPDDVTYLNSATMGILPQKSEEIGHKAVTQTTSPWEILPKDFFTNANKACSLMAQMISAKTDDVSIIPSASYGISLAVKNLTLKPTQNILVLEDQFPSNIYPWQKMAEQFKGTVKTINRPENHDWTSALLAEIGSDTAIVACAAVHWTDGTFIDLVAVGQKCRAVGAALVVDCSQSLGVMPFSVKDVDPDFMITVSYKWLLGPYSFCYAYTALRHQNGTALEESWMARKNSEDFTGLVNYQDSYQPGARRFDMGERSNFILSPIAINSLEMMLKWGVENIANYLTDLTIYAAKEARKLGLSVADQKYRGGHFIGLRFIGGVPEYLTDLLAKHKIYVGVRGDNIRISPHVYNDKSDIDRLFYVIATALK